MKFVAVDEQQEKLLAKALQKAVGAEELNESIKDFTGENEAATKLFEHWQRAFNLCVRSLSREIAKVFSDEEGSANKKR